MYFFFSLLYYLAMSSLDENAHRIIGGTRVLLVKQYDGTREKSPPRPQRCLLERSVHPPKEVDVPPAPKKSIEKMPPLPTIVNTVKHYGWWGLGGALLGAVGLVAYVNASENDI
jgi:hypothetical protein